MIADAHTHIFPRELVEDRSGWFAGEPAFRLLYDNPKARLITGEQLIEAMDEAGVDLSVTFGFPWESAERCRRGNDAVIEAALKHPDRLAPFATLPCCSVDDALAEMERCAGHAAGFGELSFYCADGGCDIRQWESEVGQHAAALGLPTLWHVTEDVGHDYPGKGGMNPKEAAGLVHRLCGSTVILAHWGGGLPFYELMPEMKSACANVYYDTAASPYLYDKRIYEIMVSIIGAERILFGSDYPLIHPKRYKKQIEQLDLSRADMDAILGGNLMRLLASLSGKEPG